MAGRKRKETEEVKDTSSRITETEVKEGLMVAYWRLEKRVLELENIIFPKDKKK